MQIAKFLLAETLLFFDFCLYRLFSMERPQIASKARKLKSNTDVRSY